jgi:putative ABC transport system permease protein
VNRRSFSLLAKMGRREIKSNWAQFLAIIAIGGIAVTLFVGLLANAESFENRVNDCYDEGNLADIWVTTSGYDPADLATIKGLIGEGGSVESRFEMTGQAGYHAVYSVVESAAPTISKPYQIVAEDATKQTSSYFVMVDASFEGAAEGKATGTYDVGDPFTISTDMSAYSSAASALSDFMRFDDYFIDDAHNVFKQDTLSLTYTLTGLMKYPENITKASYNTSAVLLSDSAFKEAFDALLTANFKPTLSAPEKAEGIQKISEALAELRVFLNDGTGTDPLMAPNQYLVSLKDHATASEDEEKIQAAFEAKAPSDQNLALLSDRSDMPFVTTVHNDVVQARQFTFLFPFVFFFVAILVILTTTSQIVLKERTQIGTLKALGLSRGQIYFYYIIMTLSLVGIGTFLGEILGPLIIPYIMGEKYSLLYTLPAQTYTFPLLYGLLTALVFLAVGALVTFLVCRREVSLKPAESMRPVPPKAKKAVPQSFLKKKSVRILSLKMAFRNLRLDFVKSAMVIVGVMGCTALLVCGYGIENTVNYGIDHDMAMGNNADIALTFTGGHDVASLQTDLGAIDGVASFEPLSRSISTMYLSGGPQVNSYIYILGNDGASHFKTAQPLPRDEVALSQKVAEETGAQAGDAITFGYGTSKYSGKIAFLYDAFIFNGVVVNGDSPILGDWGQAYLGAYVDLKPGYDPDVVKATITTSLKYILNAQTQADWAASISDTMKGILVMTNAVKVFAILLALVVLYNLALMNFKERTRDIATLKVLGFGRGEIASSLLWETMTLTFLGVGFGLLLGYPFLIAVLKLNSVDLVSYLITIYPLTYLYSFLLTFVVALGVNGWLSFRTGKVKMVESLKSVE